MLNLEKPYRLSCTFIEGSILELQQFPDRMKGCYQLIVQPWDPNVKDELDLIFQEGAGPFSELDYSEVYGQKDTLILESIVKPFSPDFAEDEKELQSGTSLEVTIKPELKGVGENLYPQLTIMFVDKHHEGSLSDDYWSSLPNSKYDW